MGLSDINMKDLAAELMLKAIDEARRDELIKGAIAHLLEPQPPAPGSFSSRDRPSLLQEAFHSAITREVNQMVIAEVKNNPNIQKQLHEAVTTGFAKFFSAEKLGDLLANRLWDLFEKSR